MVESRAPFLIAKKFVLVFENGVIVIKHWRIHNYIRGDRYVETKYKDEKSQLELDENNAYRYTSGIPEGIKGITSSISGIPGGIPSGIPNGYQVDTQVSIGKDSIGKNNIIEGKATRFIPPTLMDILDYMPIITSEEAERFIDFYASKGWYVGKNKMKDWKAALRNWLRRKQEEKKPGFSATEEMEVEDVDLDQLKEKMFGGGK